MLLFLFFGGQMIIQSINGISYRLRTAHDLSWLSNYGRVFSVIDETGSGCICFGVENPDGRFFFKIAGADTIEGEVSPAESVTALKNAVQIYRDLAHPSLISLRDSFRHGELYAAVFDWADGEGLFDHWNFDKYSAENITPPYQRFKKLPIDKRLNAVSDIISFLENTATKGYVACDFYDGSLIYDFDRDKLTICDIDFFRKAPVVNSVGEDYWGTKRLKAPEEYIKGAVIDETTNVFTLGAIIFDIFGSFSDTDIAKRYEKCAFVPCSRDKWELSDAAYKVVLRAVSPEREQRYMSISAFAEHFRNALNK